MRPSNRKKLVSILVSVALIASLAASLVPGMASAAVTATAVPRMMSFWGLNLLPMPQFDPGPAGSTLIITAPAGATVTLNLHTVFKQIFPTAASRIALFPQSIQDTFNAKLASLESIAFTWDATLGAWRHELGTESAVTWPSAAVKALGEKILFQEAVLGDINVPVKVVSGVVTTIYNVKITLVDMQRPLMPGWNVVSTPATLGISKWGSVMALGGGTAYDAAVRWDASLQRWMVVRSSDGFNPAEASYVHATNFTTIGLIFSRNVTAPPVEAVQTNAAMGGWNLISAAVVRGKSAGGADSLFEMPADALLESINGIYTTVVSPGESWTYTQRYMYSGNEVGTHDWSFNQESWVYSAGSGSPPQMVAGGGYWVNVTGNGLLAGLSQTPISLSAWSPF